MAEEDYTLPEPASFVLNALKGNTVQDLQIFSTALNEFVDILIVNERRKQNAAESHQVEVGRIYHRDEDDSPGDSSNQYEDEASQSTPVRRAGQNSTSRRGKGRTVKQKIVKKYTHVKKSSSFKDRIEQLVAFKANFGHCNVTKELLRPDPNKLTFWCKKIRYCYRVFHENRLNQGGHQKKVPYALTEEKIKQLEDIGFSWGTGKEWRGGKF